MGGSPWARAEPLGSCAERFRGEVGQPCSQVELGVKESKEPGVITGFDAGRAGGR